MLEGMAVGANGANCYLFACDETKEAVLVDPGDSPRILERWVLSKGVKVTYILLTHGHLDHIGAVADLRRALQARVAIHQADALMLTDAQANLSSLLGTPFTVGPADELLVDGQIIKVGNKQVKVLATPGHTPGGLCFVTPEGVLSGDTLFAGSIGRTDFPGGSIDELLRSIEEKLLAMPDETRVYPGHGEMTTIGNEKRDNPFL